jgi:predicted N-acetyltransferase YhbS
MKIEYRKATDRDLESISKMSSILHESECNKDEWKELIDTGMVVVAECQENTIGYVSVELFNENHNNFPNSAFVSELFVDDNYRKQGIGSQLIRLALEFKLPAQYKYFSITHAPEKQYLTDFYKKVGFKEDRVLKSGNIALIKDIK